MDKLLPCPFCGGKARWMYRKPIGWVMCKKCGASSAALSDNYEEADCQQEAIAAWNRRADAVPVVRGEWILVGTNEHDYETSVEEKCSLCGRYVYRYDTEPQDNFCPNCGAKMDAKSEVEK